MKLDDLNIQPGIFTLDTDRGSKGRWKDGNWVRFWKSLPEKIGGYQRVGESTFLGICRALSDWVSLAQTKIIALGTHLKLYVWFGGNYYDITPIRSSGTFATDPFAVTDTETTVVVKHTGHGALEGDYVTIAGASAGGGITVDGEYKIQRVIDADSYEIEHGTAATSTDAATGGASATYAYQINVGGADSVAGLGWGAGGYGLGTYGTPRSTSNFLEMARIWSLANWGEDLVACPRDGGIYLWDRSVGTGTRAAVISQAPSTAKAIFVTEENRTIVALGAHDGAADDPMLIRWCDEEDYTLWTADEDNTAGEKRLDAGNELYCRVRGDKEDLIFSDTFLWAMQFIGPPYTFGFVPRGKNGGLRSPNAAVGMNGVTFWMGMKDFYYYNGGVPMVLPCDVLNHVMDDINNTQRAKVFAGVNRGYGEVWWLYPSAGSTECDRYVLYNVNEKTWAFGELVRTAMVGDSDVFGLPYMAGSDGRLYDHDTTVNADGAAQASFLESADVEIGDGEYEMLLKRLVPDFKRLTGAIDLTITAKKYPQSSDSVTTDAIAITSTDEFINPRVKGRQMSLRFSTDAIGDDWRMGKLRVGIRPYGKK